MDQEISRFTLTIPVELLGQVRKLADANGMSINDYILLAISQRVGNI